MLRRPEFVYLFHHVGKCAGTSIVEAFGRTGRAGIFLGIRYNTRAEVRRAAREQILERRMSPSRLRAFFGHGVYHGLHHLCPQPSRYFTFVRRPTDRVVSLYNFQAGIALDPEHELHSRYKDTLVVNGKLLPFDEWVVGTYTGNHMVRFLYYAMESELLHVQEEMDQSHLRIAKQFLDKCWFVGLTERSDEDIPLVCQAVGVPSPQTRANVSKKYIPDTDRERVNALVEQRDALDSELYEYALSLRKK